MVLYLIKNLLISIFVGVLLSALFWTVFIRSDDLPSEPRKATPDPKVSITLPNFKITALQLANNARQVITCEFQKCQPFPTQQSDETPAVTDGQSWYYYQAVEDKKNVAKLQLRRGWIDSDKSDLIIEQTELVQPRGLYISPDNQKIAFWLDDISREGHGLTELWMYDSLDNGTKLIAEKIEKEGVLTEPRWNRSSTHLFFLGATFIENNKQKTVHLVSVGTPGLSTPFTNLDWGDKDELVKNDAMDISRSGQSLAYVERQWNKNILHIQDSLSSSNQTKVRGEILYVQWLTDDTLLYVVQGQHTFTFWKLNNGTHKYIAKYQGDFQSARADGQGKYLVFSTKYTDNTHRTLAMEIESGYIEVQGKLPETGGQTYLIHFETSEKTNIAGAVDRVDDDLLAGFIDRHFAEIVQEEVQPQRIIITKKPNTLFVDYTDNDKKNHRLLLTVQDIVHVEWAIIGRYEDQSGEWVNTQGRGLVEPKPIRLYEWEEGINQWILKEDFNSISK